MLKNFIIIQCILFASFVSFGATYKIVEVHADFSLESIAKNYNKQKLLGIIITTDGNYSGIVEYVSKNDLGIDFKETTIDPNLLIIHITNIQSTERSYVRLTGCSEPYDLNQMSYFFLYNDFEHRAPALTLEDNEINGLEITPVCDWDVYTLYKLNKFKACPDNKIKFYTDILIKNTKGYYPFTASSEIKDFSPKALKRDLRDSARVLRGIFQSFADNEKTNGFLRFGVQNYANANSISNGEFKRQIRGFALEYNRCLPLKSDKSGFQTFVGISGGYFQTVSSFQADSLHFVSNQYTYQNIVQKRELIINDLYDEIHFSTIAIGVNLGITKEFNLTDDWKSSLDFTVRPSYCFSNSVYENYAMRLTTTANYSNINHVISNVPSSGLVSNYLLKNTTAPEMAVSKMIIPFGIKANVYYKFVGIYLGCDFSVLRISSVNLNRDYAQYANYNGSYSSILYSIPAFNSRQFIPNLGLSIKL